MTSLGMPKSIPRDIETAEADSAHNLTWHARTIVRHMKISKIDCAHGLAWCSKNCYWTHNLTLHMASLGMLSDTCKPQGLCVGPYLTCCSTLSSRTTLKIRKAEDRLLTLLDVTRMSTKAKITITRSSLFLQRHVCLLFHLCIVRLVRNIYNSCWSNA